MTSSAKRRLYPAVRIPSVAIHQPPHVRFDAGLVSVFAKRPREKPEAVAVPPYRQ